MPRELSTAEREELTPGELAAIMGEPTEDAAAAALAEEQAATDAAARAAEAANDKAKGSTADVDEDGDPIEKPAPTAEEVAAAAAAAAAEAAKPGDKTEPTAEELAAMLEEDEKPAPTAPKPVTYKGITEDAYKTEAAKLNAEKAQAMKDLMDGTIDAEAYAKIESEVADKRDDLVANRTLARANQEAFEQENSRKMADFQTAIGALMKESAKPGAAVNYATDAKAQVQFDSASRLIAEDPDSSGLTPQQVCDKAHSMVLALRGIAANAPAAAPPAAATKTPATKANPPPVTLGGLPAAAPNAVASDLRSQFALLEGEEAEEFLERLPKAQRQSLLAGGVA